jgi:hypothetical protein
MNIIEARFEIECRLVEIAAGGRVPMIEAIVAEQGENGNDILVFAHLTDREVNGGLPLCVSVEWNVTPFDPIEFIDASWWFAGPPSCVRH